MSIDRYKKLILRLLPDGLAWNKEGESSLSKLAEGLAVELSRVDQRGKDIINESDPRTTSDLLVDWERELGLPDGCDAGTEVVSTVERRAKILARLVLRGGQSRQFFIEFISSLGFEVTITEYRQFRAGLSRAGDPVSNGSDWVNTWQLNLPAVFAYSFSAGSTAGEPLRVFRNDSVECTINRLKPAQTKVLFAYEGV